MSRACQNVVMKQWIVGGAVIEHEGQLLLVRNRRKNGSAYWTTPGGVIDEGESVLSGLAREVFEETGLQVTAWDRHLYTVTVEAPELGWSLRAEVHLVADFSGKIIVDDPDGIVEEVRWVNRVECDSLCRGNQRWLTEPLAAWLDERWGEGQRGFDYHLAGSGRSSFVVTRL